jgi:hypothetical protein
VPDLNHCTSQLKCLHTAHPCKDRDGWPGWVRSNAYSDRIQLQVNNGGREAEPEACHSAAERWSTKRFVWLCQRPQQT